MPIFIMGGSGFIGRSVVRELRRRTHVVRALARSDAAERAIREAGGEPVRGSLADLDVLRREAAAADGVVMAAQENSAGGVEEHRAAVAATVEALREGRPYLYTSGCWVYGSRGDAFVAEDAPLAPLPLVAWRPAVEALVLENARIRGIAVRAAIVYGDGGGIPGMMVAQGAGGAVQIAGDGANRWPTVRHDALAELFGLALEHRTARGAYNASRGAAIPYVEVARAASRAAGGDGSVTFLPLADARGAMGGFADALACDLQIDSGRAERELGWAPHRPTLLEELANTTVV